ncbi:MAG TPA: ATP-binding protein [Nocardioides sp.]|nr:ATP-binding protein [Nocardioides sp.]
MKGVSVDSPYSPGFGARPAVLVGRESQLARAEATLTRVANSHAAASSALVLTGARGLGKTVTLGVIAETAEDRGFVTATVAFDSVSDNVQLLAGRIAEAIAPLEAKAARASQTWTRIRQRLAGLSVEINAGVVKITSSGREPAEQRSGAGALQRQVLADLLSGAACLAKEHERPGLAVLLDELQEASREQLVVIANAVQDALRVGAGAPLVIFAAGLPETPERVMAAASFTERFDFRGLGRLDADAAERALLEPANRVGVTWDIKAAATIVQAAGGSPYLIQRLGDEAWLLADPRRGDHIGVDSAETAIAEVRDNLAGGMFRGRWAKATPMERAFMIAVAQVVDEEGIAQTRHITAVTGRSTPQWSRVRGDLIDKGLVESTGTGTLRFTMPGFAEFARSRVDAPWLWDNIRSGLTLRAQPLTHRGLDPVPGSSAGAHELQVPDHEADSE